MISIIVCGLCLVEFRSNVHQPSSSYLLIIGETMNFKNVGLFMLLVSSLLFSSN